MFKNKYRIVSDCYAGYEAQVKFWWWPFTWIQLPDPASVTNTNTFSTKEKAEAFIKDWHKGLVNGVKKETSWEVKV